MAEDVTKNEALEKFLDERSKFAIPENYVEWVRQLALELAIGVHKGLWLGGFRTRWEKDGFSLDNDCINEFGLRRWELKDWTQTLERLHGTGFVVNRPNQYVTITQAAFDLLQEASPYNVFISYRRKDSSAFALLVSHRLKQFNLMPFVDMATIVGDNWYDELHKRIKECDYFIILLGKNTLTSDMTVQEIKWAMQYREQNREQDKEEKKIIPIWHSGFGITHKKWNDVDHAVKDEIGANNAIRVTDESASGYNTAIVELLNRFGVPP